MTSTTTYYVPSAPAERIGAEELRDRAESIIQLECPEWLAQHHDSTGSALFTVTVDSTGDVQRVHTDRGTGDARLDDVLGSLAAQLRLAAGTPTHGHPPRAAVAVEFSCAPNTAAVRVNVR